MSVVHRGACYCGSASYEVTGDPVLSAYCHCTMCQRLTGCPFIHTVHFPASAFTWSHQRPDENTLDSFSPPEKPWKTRFRCKACGACVASRNVKDNKWSVWGAQMERDEDGKLKHWDALKPTAHIFYETRMLEVDDRLGKWSGYENRSECLASGP